MSLELGTKKDGSDLSIAEAIVTEHSDLTIEIAIDRASTHDSTMDELFGGAHSIPPPYTKSLNAETSIDHDFCDLIWLRADIEAAAQASADVRGAMGKGRVEAKDDVEMATSQAVGKEDTVDVLPFSSRSLDLSAL
ncbi:hypothetical protein P7K49_018124 [Saguinus oedipus]|uniref:Uncharacterized protein n=1 Tax=Saguinus oedipus TaxID=9490 RepID=A0ABQ9V4I2_SAGOE|nr:hypothetical protein P7K49_018124 [Saguinus oedipus]